MIKFKELKIWNESMQLVTDIYALTSKFPNHEKFCLSQQINRATISIPSNVAEGCGRESKKELLHFLNIANASSFELQTQVIIAHQLDYINKTSLDSVEDKIDHIQKMIYRLKQKINSSSYTQHV